MLNLNKKIFLVKILINIELIIAQVVQYSIREAEKKYFF